jgi:hypothetical protein
MILEEDGYFNSFPWIDRESSSPYSTFLYLGAHIEGKPMYVYSPDTVFQTTFYEIVGPTNRDITRNKWKAGPLHSDQRQYWPGGSFNQFCNYYLRKFKGEKVVEQYKIAVRYLRESTISVGNRI